MNYNTPQRPYQSQINKQREEAPLPPVNEIKFDGLKDDIFDSVARKSAVSIEKNNSTQIRKFYEEFCKLNDKAKATKTEKEFSDILPFIKMMNSKVAYAKGRKNVNENFVVLMLSIVSQVKDKKTMQNAKLFFEAVVGFHKEIADK
ncbi:MAG: hypothetical protein BWY78_01257 [Alphaproteobacteria bacterium ADurb.Bin438]|nr:MAG: hypothetical protein BWY78_01257 [Alphaproteobacteria bacterium ADurb.Bin438]